jgi:hypothetical protein
MSCCGALTRVYSDAGKRIHKPWCDHHRKKDHVGEEKVSEYEGLSSDWPKDVEVGAVNPAEVPDDSDEDDAEPQETPADDGDKTSAIVFDQDNEDDDEEDLF